MNDRELLWKLYEDNRLQARHHETLRATGTALLAAGAGVVMTAIVENGKTPSDLPLSIFLMLIGLFGVLFCWKEYERTRLHRRRSERFLDLLGESDETFDIGKMKAAEDRAHSFRYPILSRVQLNFLWISMHLFIFGFGTMFTLAALGVNISIPEKFHLPRWLADNSSIGASGSTSFHLTLAP
jgi:hypothetical protein